MIRTTILALALILSPTFAAMAETTPGEKAGEVVDDAAKNAKKMGRAAKDKGCEMINGKLECLGKKAKHKMQNVGDEVKDKADDVQKKVD